MNTIKPVLDIQKHGHKYTLDDIPLPSVTAILGKMFPKPFLLKAAVKKTVEYSKFCYEHNGRFDEKIAVNYYQDCWSKEADKGTKLHNTIEEYLKTGDSSVAFIGDSNSKMFRGFLEWEERTKPEYVLSEMPLVSKIYGYAGQEDLVVIGKNKTILYDVKTSAFIGKDFNLQTAAYCQGILETYGIKIDERRILHFDKMNDCLKEDVLIESNQFEDFSSFVQLLLAYKDLDSRGYLSNWYSK